MKDIFISFPEVVQAVHSPELYRPVIKTEVVFGKHFVVFNQTGRLVCHNILAFAFQTQQQCIFQLTGKTAKRF